MAKKITDTQLREFRSAYADGRLSFLQIRRATEALQFDHIDPTTKMFEIGNQIGRSWNKVKAEVLKCQVLCYKCHKDKSALEASLWISENFAGQDGPRAKLSNDEVERHRIDFKAGNITITELANKLGMTANSVRRMLRGHTYINAGGPLASADESINHISPERRVAYKERVKELYERGVQKLSDICKEVPVSSHTAKAYLVDHGHLNPDQDLTANKTLQPHAKLTPEQVRDTRERYATGSATQTELAREFRMSITGMGRLLDGRSYSAAGGPLKPRKRVRRRFTDAKVLAIREQFAAAPSVAAVAALAEHYQVTNETICHIVRGKTYSDVGGAVGVG